MKKVKLEYIRPGTVFLADNQSYVKIADLENQKSWVCEEEKQWEATGVTELESNTLVWIADEESIDKSKTRRLYTCVEWVDVEVGEEVRLVSNIMRQYVGTKVDANRLDLGEVFGKIKLPHNSLVILENYEPSSNSA